MSDEGVEKPSFLFLTGATGHTGSHLARRLLDEGRRLRCLNHNPATARHLPQHDRLEIVRGDAAHPETWTDALRGAEALFHLAHVGFGASVADACAAAGVRRVIALSSTRRLTKFPEESAWRVRRGEAALESSDLDYTILRSSMIFGGDRDNNMERLVRWLRRHRWAPLLAGGRNLVQPIFVWDLVDALVRALQRPQTTARRILTVAGPQALTQRALFEAVARAMGRRFVWLPVPHGAAVSAAALIERLPVRRPWITRAQIRRTLEDKAFEIGEARAALGGWQPRPFDEAIRLKLDGQA
jgi:uncharacterized protein YbjT (DUF2867 family)